MGARPVGFPARFTPPFKHQNVRPSLGGIGAASRGVGAVARRVNLRGPGSFASGSQYSPWHFTHYFCTGERPFRTAHDLAAGAPGAPAGTDRSPCTADARSVPPRPRLDARPLRQHEWSPSTGLPPHGHPRPGGSRSHSMLTTQRVPERFGTAAGARLGFRTAGPLSDRPPARGRPVPQRPPRRAGHRPRSTALG